jgi:dynein heavy chain, axonemal
MNSPEREQVKFSREIDVNHGEKKGQVEIWLLEIEDTMRFTLRQLSKDCFLETDRTKRINDYPAMTVLSINMINWSKGVENALDNEKLDDESKKLELELQGLVQMVRGGLGE